METHPDSNKPTVFLDLDNTLISAEALSDFPFHKPGMKEKSLKFALHDMDNYYIVFERPGVQDFLDWLFQTCNVCVWTAASKDYALFIIDRIILKKPGRRLWWFLFSHHCDLAYEKFKDDKRLKLVFDVFCLPNIDSKRCIIIDDRKDVFTCQPENAIHIKAFEILGEGSENDAELKNVKRELQERLNI